MSDLSKALRKTSPLSPATRFVASSTIARRIGIIGKGGQEIRIEDVVVLENRRSVKPKAVAALADAMSIVGQLEEITVRRAAKNIRPVLADGLHRLEAARQLGWTCIRAKFLEGSETDARLFELVTSLCRADLNALEHDEHVAEWARLTETRKAVSGQNVRKPGRPQGGLADVARDLPIPGKTEEARRKSIERSIKIDSMTPEAKAAVRTGLADARSALLAVAKEVGQQAQMAKVHELVARKAISSRKADRDVSSMAEQSDTSPPVDVAPLRIGDPNSSACFDGSPLSIEHQRLFDNLIRLWESAHELNAALKSAPGVVREQFVYEALRRRSDHEIAQHG